MRVLIVVELRGACLTLTKADGRTFRLLAREKKTLANYLVSKEFKSAEKQGLILLIEEEKQEKESPFRKTKKDKEVLSK